MYGKIKNVPTHQPDIDVENPLVDLLRETLGLPPVGLLKGLRAGIAQGVVAQGKGLQTWRTHLVGG
jgi:hypothetical protein